MKIDFNGHSDTFSSVLSHPKEISIPLQFDGPQPNHFGVESATSEVITQGSYVGDVNEGGSCNCSKYTVTPHCNGTHTECVGHITSNAVSISDVLRDSLFKTTVITVNSTSIIESDEHYIPKAEQEDRFITAKEIRRAIDGTHTAFHEALIVRTLPNDQSKKARSYPENPPPFFSNDAMEYIVSLGVNHLLVDLPSVDRMYDDGKLSCHRIFWDNATSLTKTITEMIYVDDSITDGSYLVAIQIPSFVADAAPSRVFLYDIEKRK